MRVESINKLILGVAISALVCGLVACGGSPAAGGTTGPQSLTVYAPNPTVGNLPFYVAEANGYFDKQNVTINFNDAGGANIIDLLLNGQTDLVDNTVSQGLQVVKKGKPLTYVFDSSASLSGPLPIGLEGNPHISSIPQLQSTPNCSVAGPPAATIGFAFVHKVINRYSLHCNYVISQTWAEQAAGVASGQFSAAVVLSADQARLTNAGEAHTLISGLSPTFTQDWGMGSMGLALFGEPSHVKSEKTAIVRMIKGLIQAYNYIQSKAAQPDGLAVLANDLLKESPVQKATPIDVLQSQIKTSLAGWAPPGLATGQITKALWDQSLSAYADFGVPALAKGSSDPDLAYTKLVDMSYLNSASKS